MTARSKALFCAPFFLFFCLLAQGLWAIADKSPTADEMAHHVASGYSYLITDDFRMNPASPPLPRMLAALPLLLTRVRVGLEHESWKNLDAPAFARQFFYHSGEDADKLIFLSRLPILFLSMGLGWLVYSRGKKWFGELAGLGALTLYCFCPDILAHSSLATADLAVSLFMTASFFSFHDYLEKPSARLAARTGAMCALALLSKYSAILLFVILPLSALAAGRLKCLKPGRIILFLCTCLLVVWAGYFFETKPLLDRTPDPAKKAAVYQKVGGQKLLQFAEKTPVPGATFISSLASMIYTRSVGTNAYLMGEWSRKGWPWYYLVALAVKNTVPFILFGCIGFFWFLRQRIPGLLKPVFLTPVAVFFVLTLGDKAQAGIRYFLPIYPVICLLGGAAFAACWRAGGFQRIVSGCLLGGHMVSAFLSAPNYLSYFNAMAGGSSNGYRWLRDSNLDWGQDLKPLARYLKETQSPPVVLYYPWPADPAYYKIQYRPMEVSELTLPKSEIYVISAHFLDSAVWTKQETPIKKIGNSIFIYDLRKS